MIERILGVLQSKLTGRRVEPAARPDQKSVVAANEPDELSSDRTAGDVGVIPLALFIEYLDASGKASQRRIACKCYEPATETLLAHCFERRARRRFKMARIRSAVCVATGEVYDVSTLGAGLLAGGLGVRDERLDRILTVLVFMMRCDRQVHPREVEVIEDACGRFALRFDGDDSVVARGIEMAAQIAPDGDDLVKSIEWISKREDGPQLVRLLVPLVDQVIMADGKIASEEAYFGGLVKDALLSIA